MSDLTYDDWADLLGAFFFDLAHNGEEILFAVDDVSLADITGLPEEAACASLSDSVRLVIGQSWNVRAVADRVDRWQRKGQPTDHPALPFLALTVLAASRMGAYEGFAPHKFYVPLRRALVESDVETDAPGTYLHHVKGLWESLAKWANLDLGSARGVLKLQDPGRHYGRGFAVQHSLVKSHDLNQLDAFFRAIGLVPGEEIPPNELLRALRVWSAGRSEPWAVRLHRICSEPDLAGYAETVLVRESLRWDGRPRDPRTGRPVGRLRIAFNSVKRPQLGLFAQFDDRLPPTVSLLHPGSPPIALSRVNGWYEPQPLDQIDLRTALNEGLELRGDGLRFTFRSDSVHAMSYDDDLGAWTSVDSMSFGDRYHLIVRADLVSEVIRFAQQWSATPSLVEEPASKFLPPGWKLISNVRFDSRPKMTPPPCLSSLVPVGSSPRMRLVGGLPLTTTFGVYLRGGEPALGLSSLCDDDRISIMRESTRQVERFRVAPGESREIPLWSLKLEPDRYKVQHGESSVWLQIVDGIAEEAGPGAGTVAHSGRGGNSVVGTVVVGAKEASPPVLVPAPEASDSLLLLGPNSEDVLRVSRPKWMSTYVGFDLSWKMIDAWPDFPAVWLLMRGSGGRYEASLLSPAEPPAETVLGRTVWGRLIAVSSLCAWESPEAEQLWARYRTAAGATA